MLLGCFLCTASTTNFSGEEKALLTGVFHIFYLCSESILRGYVDGGGGVCGTRFKTLSVIIVICFTKKVCQKPACVIQSRYETMAV